MTEQLGPDDARTIADTISQELASNRWFAKYLAENPVAALVDLDVPEDTAKAVVATFSQSPDQEVVGLAIDPLRQAIHPVGEFLRLQTSTATVCSSCADGCVCWTTTYCPDPVFRA